MKYVVRAACLTVFLLGVFLFARSSQVSPQQRGDDAIEAAASFVLTSVQYRIAPNGDVEDVKWQTRYVNEKGEWRIVMHKTGHEANKDNEPGKDTPVFASVPGGVVGRAASGELRSLSQSSDSQSYEAAAATLRANFRSHKYLRNHPGFNRMEEVSGLKAYVLRGDISDETNPIQWFEDTYSPKTGYNPIRMVQHNRDGSEIRIEPLRIQFQPIMENLNDDLKSASNDKPPVKVDAGSAKTKK